MKPFPAAGLSLSMCLLFPAGPALAQGLSDPTRPSDFQDGNRAVTGSGPVEPGEPVLQAVVLERNRKYAVISGQIVKLGERYAGAQLVQIGDSEVVLRSGRDVKRLKLVPGVDKKPVRAAARSREGTR